MFSLISRSHVSHVSLCTVAPQKRFCSQLTVSAYFNIVKLFASHLELSFFPNNGRIVSWNSKIPSICEIKKLALQPNPYESEEAEIKLLIKENLLNVVKKTFERQPGKGVMYEETYHKEVINNGSNYAEYEIDRVQSRQKRTYPCFNTDEHIVHFFSKENVLASDAIESFFEGPTAVDCGSWSEAVYFYLIYRILGKEKFNKLFNQFEIKYHVDSLRASSIYPFLEFIDPNIHIQTDEKKLQIGDHIMVRGTPWCYLKHPSGFMNNMHGIITGFNENGEPLVSSLELRRLMTINDVYEELLLSSNKSPTADDYAYMKALHGIDDFSEAFIANFFKIHNYNQCENFTVADLLKRYSIKEVQQFGGCNILNQNSNRVSAYVLAALKNAPPQSDLQDVLLTAKAVVLYKTFYHQFPKFFEKLNFLYEPEKYGV